MRNGPKSNPLKKLQDAGVRIADKFYSGVTGCAGKLGRLLKLSSLLAVMEKRLSRNRRVIAVELFVALSLTVSFFFVVRTGSRPGADGDTMPKALFLYLSHKTSAVDTQQIPASWRMRLAAPILSAWLLDASPVTDSTGPAFENLFGLFHTTWLFLLFLLLIFYRKDALLIMLGIMGGLFYYLSDPVRPQFYPWDMATMFFFTLACLLFTSRRMWLLMMVVWIGALFKETTLCCALLILLGEQWSWRKRILGFAGTVLITFASYKFLMSHYHLSGHVLAMNQAANTPDLFLKSVLVNNLHVLFSLDPRHVLFVNAGSLFLMLLIPWKDRRGVILKLVIITYVIGEFFWGVINEFRIWYEVLPLGWIIISDALLAWRSPGQDTLPGNQKANRVLQGSYWLMMGGLLAVAVVICATTTPTLKPVANQAIHMSTAELLVAASHGDTNAQFQLGIDYDNGVIIKQDPYEAAHWYELAARSGQVDAQNALGMLLFNQGYYTNAIYWFGRAAAAGNEHAQFNLGAIYSKGVGVPQDDALAFQLFQKPALHGLAQAEEQLGLMYQSGRGVAQDYVAAYAWLKLAVLQGVEPATAELQACAALMTPEQVSEAEKLALNLKPGARPHP